MQLKFGCTVEQDSDGDWIICPPANVKIFSVMGEGVLLSATDRESATVEAQNYLSVIDDLEAYTRPST